MPELPDIEAYLYCLGQRILYQTLEGVRLNSPFILRSVEPSLEEATGREVVELRRLGKRIVFGLQQATGRSKGKDKKGGDKDPIFIVLHLMIAGRLHWKQRDAKLSRKFDLLAMDFPSGSLLLTEAGTKKRASLHLVRGETDLAAHDPGGIEIFATDTDGFYKALTRKNHTIKRALNDPRIVSGIGNAYSDEILHRARLSPFKLTSKLSTEEVERLFNAARELLSQWTELLKAEVGDGFVKKVTAFRKEFAVHGKYKEPCPVCRSPVQRIAYATKEANYCVHCQTGGKLLADRGLSRLLKKDWPRTLEALEELKKER